MEQGDADRGKAPGDRDHLVTAGIAGHPLYQQTIRDVLSDDAYARYRASQSERHEYRRQAACALAMACLDNLLLLNEPQRKQLETAAARQPSARSAPAMAVMGTPSIC